MKQLQNEYAQTTEELTTRNHELTRQIEQLMHGDHLRVSQRADKSKSPFPANPDIGDYDTDDEENDNTARYTKYVPPTVKHIMEASNADNGHHGGHQHLEHKIREQQEAIDNYISIINRKDTEMTQIRQKVEKLEEHNRYVCSLRIWVISDI